MSQKEKVYFMADSHLGSLLFENSHVRLESVCRWLNYVSTDASDIYLLGDVFDFWYEFAHAVPPGFDALLDTMRSVVQQGTAIHFFPGNHDQWTYGYLAERALLTVHHSKEELVIKGKRFLLAHGHGLGEKRMTTKLLNLIFENKALRTLFRYCVVPKWGLAFGYKWSARNRLKHDRQEADVDDRIDYYASHSSDSEAFQVKWAKEYVAEHADIDFIIMGHLHHETNMMLGNGTQLLILDAFYKCGGYAWFDGDCLCLDNFVDDDV